MRSATCQFYPRAEAKLPGRSHIAALDQEVTRLERLLRRKTFEIEVLEEALAAEGCAEYARREWRGEAGSHKQNCLTACPTRKKRQLKQSGRRRVVPKRPDRIAVCLDAALEDGDPETIKAALGNIARVKGMTEIAEKAGTRRPSLYKSLSPTGNPQLATIANVLDALGLRLSVTIKRAASKRGPAAAAHTVRSKIAPVRKTTTLRKESRKK